MGGRASSRAAFVHNRFLAVGRPHPTRACARPTFPLGEGSGWRGTKLESDSVGKTGTQNYPLRADIFSQKLFVVALWGVGFSGILEGRKNVFARRRLPASSPVLSTICRRDVDIMLTQYSID